MLFYHLKSQFLQCECSYYLPRVIEDVMEYLQLLGVE